MFTSRVRTIVSALCVLVPGGVLAWEAFNQALTPDWFDIVLLGMMITGLSGLDIGIEFLKGLLPGKKS